MVNQITAYITQCDPEVGAAIEKELARQRRNIELIASENIVSPAVLAAAALSVPISTRKATLENANSGGCEFVDIAENLAIERAKKLFSAGFANVQPHSGAQANYACYMALCEPGIPS